MSPAQCPLTISDEAGCPAQVTMSIRLCAAAVGCYSDWKGALGVVACVWLCPRTWGAEAGLLGLHNEFQVILGYDAVSVKTEKIQNTKQEGENLICAKHLLCAGQHPEELFTHCFTYALIFTPYHEFNNIITRFLQMRKTFGTGCLASNG